jgi:hypothetical protein
MRLQHVPYLSMCIPKPLFSAHTHRAFMSISSGNRGPLPLSLLAQAQPLPSRGSSVVPFPSSYPGDPALQRPGGGKVAPLHPRGGANLKPITAAPVPKLPATSLSGAAHAAAESSPLLVVIIGLVGVLGELNRMSRGGRELRAAAQNDLHARATYRDAQIQAARYAVGQVNWLVQEAKAGRLYEPAQVAQVLKTARAWSDALISPRADPRLGLFGPDQLREVQRFLEGERKAQAFIPQVQRLLKEVASGRHVDNAARFAQARDWLAQIQAYSQARADAGLRPLYRSEDFVRMGQVLQAYRDIAVLNELSRRAMRGQLPSAAALRALSNDMQLRSDRSNLGYFPAPQRKMLLERLEEWCKYWEQRNSSAPAEPGDALPPREKPLRTANPAYPNAAPQPAKPQAPMGPAIGQPFASQENESPQPPESEAASEQQGALSEDQIALLRQFLEQRPEGRHDHNQSSVNLSSLMQWLGGLSLPASLVGERIRRGQHNDVFAMSSAYVFISNRPGDEPGFVLGQPTPIAETARRLRELQSMGFPVPVFAGPVTLDDGRSGLVMERFPGGTRDNSGKQLLNERSISDLNNIVELLYQQDLYIGDLQFLVREDGSLTITDPGPLVRYPSSEMERENRQVIENVRQRAQKNMGSSPTRD